MTELKTKLDEFSQKKSVPVEETKQSTNLYDLPEFIQTKRSPVAMLSSDLVSIKVTKVSFNITSGLFKINHTLFTIETSPYGWTVVRGYKDLALYRELIHKQFPGDIVI